MAYKFQFGQAILSGALDQEGDVQVKDQSGNTQIKLDDNGIISGSGNFQLAGDLKMAGGTSVIQADGDTQFKLMASDDAQVGTLLTVGKTGVAGAIGHADDTDLLRLTDQSIITSADSLLTVGGGLRYQGVTVTSTGAELNLVDGSQAGTVVNSKAVIYDALGGITAVGLTGSLQRSLDVEANGGLGMTPFNNSADVSDLKISGSFILETGPVLASESFVALSPSGTVKQFSIAALATSQAGDGLAASSGVLSVGVDDSSIELNSDALRVKAGGIATSMLADDAVDADKLAANAVVEASIVDNAVSLAKLAGITRGSIILGDASGDPSLLAKGTAAQFLQSDGTDPSYVSISGDATIAAGGALTISADAVEPSMINIFDDSLAATDTHILIADGSDYSSFALSGDVTMTNAGVVTIAANAVEDSMVNDNVATGLAGDGLAASSGVLSVGVDDSTIETSGDALRLKDDGVTGAKLAPAVAGAGLAQDGSGNLDIVNASNGGIDVQASDIAVDINNLATATVDVAADFLAFSDEGAAGDPTKKVSFADLAVAMAGSGISASNGVLSTQAGAAANLTDGAALAEGYNFATGSAGATVSTPAGAEAGDVIVVKRAEVGDVVINGFAANTIDGEDSILLESPFAAVTLVYSSTSGSWSIV